MNHKNFLFLSCFLIINCLSCLPSKVDSGKSGVKLMTSYMENLNTDKGPLSSPAQCQDPHFDPTLLSLDPSELLNTIKKLDKGLLKTPRENAQGLHQGLNLQELFYDYALLGGDPKSLAQALCFHNKNRDKEFKAEFHQNGPEDLGDMNKPEDLRQGKMRLQDSCQIFINDMNKLNSEPRFFAIDLCHSKVVAMPSADPYGGISQSTDSMPKEGNGEMPHGFHLMGGKHEGEKPWSPGRRLHGLEKDINHNSSSRLIAFHRGVSKSKTDGKLFRYVKPGINSNIEGENSLEVIGPEVYAEGKSAGCSVVSPENFELIDKITETNTEPSLETPGLGSLFYIYGPLEKAQDLSYCGPNQLNM